MSNTIVNYTEAKEEAERLSRVHRRSVEVKAVECCDYDKSCGCGGGGLRYELIFAYCGHVVGDGDLIQCEESDCAERERLAVNDPFAGLAQPLKSLSECASEREEEMEMV